MPANTARTEHSVHVTHTVTSFSSEIGFSSNNPFFHPSSNPNRKATVFARRPLDQEYPCLIPDARYEKVRETGVIRPRTVLVAIGISWDVTGRRVAG